MHFSLLVLQDNNSKSLEDMMAPFCEGLPVNPYVYKTREEALKAVKHFLKAVATKETINEYSKMSETEQIRDYYGLDTDEDGNVLTTYNPNSKWDWFDIGGRWSKCIKISDGKAVNSCLVSDIDFYLGDEAKEEAIRYWDRIAMKNKDVFMNKDKYKAKYGSKEDYIKQFTVFHTYAVLTPNGEWIEQDDGNVKAWIDDYEKLVTGFGKDIKATIVDCHI